MSKPGRGRTLAAKIVDRLGTMANPIYPMTVRRSRIPKVVLAELGGTTADVTVASQTKAGDEQDRSSEQLLYGISVGVTAYVGESEDDRADLVEDLVEQIQDFLSDEAQECFDLGGDDLDNEAQLERPFVNDPTFNLSLLREKGVYQSITVFNYVIEKDRQSE